MEAHLDGIEAESSCSSLFEDPLSPLLEIGDDFGVRVVDVAEHELRLTSISFIEEVR
jgi:hypothetical protein